MSLTPNDRAKKDFIDPVYANCWITTTDPMLVTNALTAPQQQTLIERACARINRMCNRYFNSQEADEVFINDRSYYISMQTYVLENAPLNSITDIYLQVLDQFVQITQDYIQEFSVEGVVRLLPFPESLQALSLSLDAIEAADKLNMWFRYTSGYTAVPADVQLATAYMYNYLYSTSQNPAGIKSFRTQTTTEVYGVDSMDNPALVAIKDLLTPYMRYSVK